LCSLHLLWVERGLCGVEVGDDVAHEDVGYVGVGGGDEGSAGVLRAEVIGKYLGVADGEGVEEAHRLVDKHVGEDFGIGVEVRPLQDTLDKDESPAPGCCRPCRTAPRPR
jgi:hypothetical protein